MNEPSADDSANIRSTPINNITKMTGASHHIFLSFINVNRSRKNSIMIYFVGYLI